MKAPLHVVLCEAREGQTSRNTILDHVASALAEREDVEVTVVPHLYDLTPDGPAMTYLRSLEGDLLVVAAMVPRAAYWVLDANEVRGRMGSTLLTLDENDVSAASADKQAERTIWCLDIRRHGDALPYWAKWLRFLPSITARRSKRSKYPTCRSPTVVLGWRRLPAALVPVVDRQGVL